MKIWQGISGGVETGEIYLETAKRECVEETKMKLNHDFIALDATASIPANIFGFEKEWGENTYIVKEVSFGIEVDQEDLILSHEHEGFVWCDYEEAFALLTFDSNKVALWELNERIARMRKM